MLFGITDRFVEHELLDKGIRFLVKTGAGERDFIIDTMLIGKCLGIRDRELAEECRVHVVSLLEKELKDRNHAAMRLYQEALNTRKSLAAFDNSCT